MRKVVTVVVSLIGISSFAATWTDGNSVEWKYTVVDGNVIIDGASGYGSDLVVPETISGKTVIEIRENAVERETKRTSA